MLLDKRAVILEKRKKLEIMIWKQRIQEKEQDMAGYEEIVELKKRELELDEKRRQAAQVMLGLDGHKHPPVEEMDSFTKTRKWLQNGSTSSRQDHSGRPTKKVTEDSTKYRLIEQIETDKEIQPPRRASMDSQTGSQCRVLELEKELSCVKKMLWNQEEHRPQGVDYLKKLGLLPPDGVWQGPPNKQERRMLVADSLDSKIDDPGKHQWALECGGCQGEKMKLKSGKYAKTNIDIKKQEQWPHLNVWRKYVCRCPFDNMDFEMFVAGETRILSCMKDEEERWGRLNLLCKISHWLCRCKDWSVIRGLYEAIIESVEMGEAQWTDCFDHYEMMVPWRDESR